MPCAGLIEMPPESNVMPLPTMQNGGDFFATPFGAYSSATSRGGRELPPPTARIAPIFRFSSSGTSSTRTASPTSRATERASCASCSGESTFGGRLESSRATF